jgi:tetratricopeptide (TPR) repeat protein
VDEHLTPALLRQVEKREVPPWALAALALSHLGRLCPACKEALSRFARGRPPGGTFVRLFGRDDEAVYREAFDRALAAAWQASRLAEKDAPRSLEAVRRLLAGPRQRRTEMVESEKALHTLPAFDALMAEGRRRLEAELQEAVEVFTLALAVAGRLTAATYGHDLPWGCRAVAAAELARARQAQGDVAGAWDALRLAEGASESSGREPYALGEVLLARAHLLRSGGRRAEALAELARARLVYRRVGDPHREGAAQVVEGLVLREMRRRRHARRILRQALEKLVPGQDRALFQAARLALLGLDAALRLGSRPSGSRPRRAAGPGARAEEPAVDGALGAGRMSPRREETP